MKKLITQIVKSCFGAVKWFWAKRVFSSNHLSPLSPTLMVLVCHCDV